MGVNDAAIITILLHYPVSISRSPEERMVRILRYKTRYEF
jgi:hypothetical protein